MIEPVTAKQMLLDYAVWNAPVSARIIARFAVEHDITVADLKSKKRDHRISHLRQDLMLELRENTELSLPQIGRLFGRDHTTVLHGLRMATKRRAAGIVSVDDLLDMGAYK